VEPEVTLIKHAHDKLYVLDMLLRRVAENEEIINKTADEAA